MATINVNNTKIKTEVKRYVFDIGENGMLVNGRWMLVSRNTEVIAGKYIIPSGMDLSKKWKIDTDGNLQEHVDTENQSVILETQKIKERENAGIEIVTSIKAAMNIASTEAVKNLVSSSVSAEDAYSRVLSAIDRANDEFLTKVTVYIREGSFEMALYVLSENDNSMLYAYLGNEFKPVMQEAKEKLQSAIAKYY